MAVEAREGEQVTWGRVLHPDGKPIWLRLVCAGETPIRRHVKVHQEANPVDPQ